MPPVTTAIHFYLEIVKGESEVKDFCKLLRDSLRVRVQSTVYAVPDAIPCTCTSSYSCSYLIKGVHILYRLSG